MRDPGAALARCREQHQLVVELGAFALSGGVTLDALLQHAVELAARGTGIAQTKVMEYRAELDGLFVRAGTGWRDGVVGRLVMSADPREAQGAAFQSGGTLLVEDLARSEYRVPQVLREHGIAASVTASILVEGKVWGGIEVDSTEPGSLGADDALLLQGFAHILGRAIEQQAAAAALAGAALDRDVALKEREVLFRELHHRVANNFMAIIGLLELGAQKTGSPDAAAVLTATADRVAAISEAHEQLSLGDVEKEISFAVYLTRLLAKVPLPERVRLIRRIRDATVPLRTAVRLGMIANELVTNSVKHAFPDRVGTVTVSFGAEKDPPVGRLSIADDGTGIVASRAGGSGLDLLQQLVGQIGGELRRESSPGRGTETTVTFPLG